MQESIINFFDTIGGYVWGAPMLILLVGTGIYLTIALKGIQFRGLVYSLKLAFWERKEKDSVEGDISHFQALMTALAATVGTGNIAGVATAIALGGPGALFWMWITGLFGMATKYAEAVLAVKYRETNEYGEMSGGPMYYISNGLGWKWLGALFSIFAAVAAFGIGNMVQSNSVADVVNSEFGVPKLATGIIMAVATACVILGGIKSISRVTQFLVPVMIVVYMVGASIILLTNITEIPGVIQLVFTHAFTPTAASGGFAGAMVLETIRWGVARGVFSNESGLGSSPIAAAAAKTKNPVRQGLVSMTQTFIDTLIVCSFTGFVIILSGVWSERTSEEAASMTSLAFSEGVLGEAGGMIVAITLMFFAYSTILGWSYYGEKSLGYLFGSIIAVPYRIVFCLFVFTGAVVKLDLVWSVADVFNGLMAVPNLIGLLFLSRVLMRETNRFYYNREDGK